MAGESEGGFLFTIFCASRVNPYFLLGGYNPDIPQIMHKLAYLLIPQEIFPQSGVINDTPLLQLFLVTQYTAYYCADL